MNQLGSLFQLFAFNTGTAASGISIKMVQAIADSLETDGLFFTKLLVLPAFFNDNFSQGLDPENVRARFYFQMHSGIFYEIRFPGIGQNLIKAALFGAFFHLHPDDRVGECRMRPYQKNRFGGFIVLQKGADRTVAQLPS